MLLGSAIQLGFSLVLGETLAAVRLTPSALLAPGYLSVLAGGVGFGIYFDLPERLGPLSVNLVTNLNPIVAVLLGWPSLGEPLVATASIGLPVVFAGFALIGEEGLAVRLARYRGGPAPSWIRRGRGSPSARSTTSSRPGAASARPPIVRYGPA